MKSISQLETRYCLKQNIVTRRIYPVVLVTGILLLTACGSDDNSQKAGSDVSGVITGIGTASQGLALPKSIDLGSFHEGGVSGMAVTDPGTDYSMDPVEKFTTIDANISLDMVNSLLCMIDSVDAVSRVNQGAYQSSFQNDPCNKDMDTADEIAVEVTVISYRETDTSPHIIQFWAQDNSFQERFSFVAEVVTTKAVSEQDPYGEFVFNYRIYRDAGDHGGTAGNWIQTDRAVVRSLTGDNGLPRLEMIMNTDTRAVDQELPFIGRIVSVTEVTSSDLQSGQSFVQDEFAFDVEFISSNEYSSVFNQDYILDSNAEEVLTTTIGPDGTSNTTVTPETSSTCKSRTVSVDDVWAYNLYYNEDTTVDGVSKTAGQRVETLANSLNFAYTHTVANDRNGVFPDPLNSDFSLYYQGPGQLWGFPYDEQNNYKNMYNLNDGTVLLNDTGSYVVKAVEVEQASADVAMELCADLDLSSVNINLDTVEPIPGLNIDLDDWPTTP